MFPNCSWYSEDCVAQNTTFCIRQLQLWKKNRSLCLLASYKSVHWIQLWENNAQSQTEAVCVCVCVSSSNYRQEMFYFFKTVSPLELCVQLCKMTNCIDHHPSILCLTFPHQTCRCWLRASVLNWLPANHRYRYNFFNTVNSRDDR